MMWAIVIVGLGLLFVFGVLLCKVFFGPETYSKEVKVAVVSLLATMLTILGSVIVAQRTNVAIARQQRAAEVRKIKQQYYHAFFDAFWKKHASLQTTPHDKQAQLEANRRLCMEAGRLPLYASQAFTELIGRSMKGPAEARETTTIQMYELMRADLVTDDYKAFTRLETGTMIFPNPPDS